MNQMFFVAHNGCYIGTLHSFAFQLLQRYVPKYESYDVLDDHRLAAVLAREAKRIGLKDLTGKLYESIQAFIANFDVVQNELIPVGSLDDPFKSVLAEFLERLESYRLLTYGQQIASAVRKALDISGQVMPDHLVMPRLAELSPRMPLEAVECLMKIVEGDKDRSGPYTWGDSAKTIIRSALCATDVKVRQAAVETANRLASHGYFDFISLVKDSGLSSQ